MQSIMHTSSVPSWRIESGLLAIRHRQAPIIRTRSLARAEFDVG